MNAVLKSVAPAWLALERTAHVGPIKNRAHYDEMAALANTLIDEIGSNKKHPLNGLLYVIGECIANYDRVNYPVKRAYGVDVLRDILTVNDLTQSQVPEIGNQSVVSQILAGKRHLNARQIGRLAKRFAIPANAFLEEDFEGKHRGTESHK